MYSKMGVFFGKQEVDPVNIEKRMDINICVFMFLGIKNDRIA